MNFPTFRVRVGHGGMMVEWGCSSHRAESGGKQAGESANNTVQQWQSWKRLQIKSRRFAWKAGKARRVPRSTDTLPNVHNDVRTYVQSVEQRVARGGCRFDSARALNCTVRLVDTYIYEYCSQKLCCFCRDGGPDRERCVPCA